MDVQLEIARGMHRLLLDARDKAREGVDPEWLAAMIDKGMRDIPGQIINAA